MNSRYIKPLKKYLIEIIVFFMSSIFSFWLMFSTFSYKNGFMLIATKAWSDFASHIPLIRSFSLGSNFPPQYPIFPGEPIRYHFLFYFLVGILEKAGLRIDWSLNLLSTLSFLALMLIIYLLGKELFKSKAVGILSLIFFLFNGSLSFIEFFKLHPLPSNTINDIIKNNAFPSFGPYDGKIVSAFWNLNIYTNQRHLALALAVFLLIIFFITKYERKKKNLPPYLTLLFGVLIGILPFFHSSVFLMILAVLGILLVLFSSERKSLFLILLVGAFISLPRVLFLEQAATYIPHIQIGYLIANQLSFYSFTYYWIMNLGLSFIFIPIGFLFSPKLAKKVFIAFFSLFLIGNLFQFSIEMAGNHKFFNAFLIVGNMFSAFFLVRSWQKFKFLRVFILLAGFFLIFSGIIDFFPIKNDSLMTVSDYPNNSNIRWVMKNTPKNSIFLNTSYTYDQASLAGRKIFLGWPYFPWSLGYDTLRRSSLMKDMLGSQNKKNLCMMLKNNNINYIEISGNNLNNSDLPRVSSMLISDFMPIYSDRQTNYNIYSTVKICQNTSK
jgi:hypothetical protein